MVHAWCVRLLYPVPAQHWFILRVNNERRSVANGYDIAIASAGCKTDFVKSFLQRRVAPDGAEESFFHSTGDGGLTESPAGTVFTDAFFRTPAFQMCQPIKTSSLGPILDYYQLVRRCFRLCVIACVLPGGAPRITHGVAPPCSTTASIPGRSPMLSEWAFNGCVAKPRVISDYRYLYIPT